MALTPETRLGPYQIVGLLGAGGMGEVYRATDTSLGRQVAIKVLPEAFAHDAERLARFEREARTLASLSHPTIAVVFGLERSADALEKRLPPGGPFKVGSPRLSPDGKWIAYATDVSGRPEVWLAQYPSGDGRVLVSRDGGIMPEWKMDGRELYYVSRDQRLMAVAIEATGSNMNVGVPTPILQLPDMVPVGRESWVEQRSYAPSPDGRRFLVETLAPGVRQPPIQVIVNWPALLKK